MFLSARPHITVFGVDIYYYAIIIVSGIAIAIGLFARFLKKNGYDPYDAVDYAIVVIPLAIFARVLPVQGAITKASSLILGPNGSASTIHPGSR